MCKKEDFWSSNHMNEERLAAPCQTRKLRQYFTVVQDSNGDEAQPKSVEEEHEIYEEQIDALEYIATDTHVVQVNIYLYHGEYEQQMSYFATTDGKDNSTLSIACTRDATVSHALNASMINDSRYNVEYFYGLMVDKWCALAIADGLS